jgi:hypothetical protein
VELIQVEKDRLAVLVAAQAKNAPALTPAEVAELAALKAKQAK